MKVIVTESKLGIEYLADVISSCNQNGIECIVDDNAGEILYYLPKEGRYGDDKLLQNSDESIFDLVTDKARLVNILKDAQGDEFKEFAVKWNDLQKKGEDEEVYKTQHCNPIRGNFSERARNTRPTTAKDREEFEKFRKRWKSLGKKKKKDDEEEDYVDDFGMRVNGIEAQVSEGDESDDWSASEDEVEVQWMIDDKELGIESGSTETVVIDLDLVDSFEELVYQVELALEKAHGGMQFDYDDEWILIDEDDLIKRFGCSMLESESNGRTLSEGEVEIMWTVDYPEFGIESGNTESFVVDYDNVAPDNEYDIENNGLRDEVCRLISDEYPGLDFEPYDFDILNEREFWGEREKT